MSRRNDKVASLLTRLLLTSPDCIYVCDVATRRATFRTRRLWQQLGYKKGEVDAPGAVIPNQFMEPGERADLDELFRAVRALNDGCWLDTYFRLRDKAGRTRHFRSRMTPLDRGPAGETSRFIGTITDVTAQKEAEIALDAARRLAERGSAAKTRFLADLAHELRTPLHVVTGALELLARGALDAEAARLVDLGRRAGEALAGLVEDALDLGAVEAGRLAIHAAPFAPAALAEAAAAAHRLKAREKDLELSVHIDPAVPLAVAGDARRIGQILHNFLANAVKFTDKGAIKLRVTARAAPADTSRSAPADTSRSAPADASSSAPPAAPADCVRLRFVVADSGPGIDPAFGAQVFERFAREEGAIARAVPGAGLGLAIARDLAAAMGGRVGYSSTGGCGTDFWLELALPVVAAPDAIAPAPPAEHEAPLAGVILIADDNPDNLRLAAAMTRAVGGRAVLAGNGEEALWTEESARPAVIFLDYRMPVMDGLEAARRLRARGVLTPIFLLTANADAGLRAQSRGAGVDEVLMKPLRLRDLRRCLEPYLRADGPATAPDQRRKAS